MNGLQSINHVAGYERNWTCWNESGEVFSPAAVYFKQVCTALELRTQLQDGLSRTLLPVMVEDFQKPEMVTAVIPGSPTLSMEDFTSASESCPELSLL